MRGRHFLSITDVSPDELALLLRTALALKALRHAQGERMEGALRQAQGERMGVGAHGRAPL